MKGPLTMEPLPPGTQNICERKRLYEDHHGERKKPLAIDRGGKLDQMPTWKRDLLKRRRHQSEAAEQPLVITNDHVFAETNYNMRSDGVILSTVDGVSSHDSSFESKLSPSYPKYSSSGKLLVDQEKIGSVLDNPFFKSDGKKAVLTRHNSSGDYTESVLTNHVIDDSDTSSETEEIYKPGSGFVHKLNIKFSRLSSREPEAVVLRKRSASLENILDDKIVDKEKNRLSGAKLLNDENNYADRGRVVERRFMRTASTDSASPSDRTRSPRDRSDSRTRKRANSDAPDINLAKDIILVETSPSVPSLLDVSASGHFVHINSLTTEQEPEDDLPRQNVVSSTRSKFEHKHEKKAIFGPVFTSVTSTEKPNPVITTVASTMPVTTVSNSAVSPATKSSTVVTQSNKPEVHKARLRENNNIPETSVKSGNHSNVVVNGTNKSNNIDFILDSDKIDSNIKNNLIKSTKVVVSKPQIKPEEVEIAKTDIDDVRIVPDKNVTKVSINTESEKASILQDTAAKRENGVKKDVKKKPPKPPQFTKMEPVSVPTSNATSKPKTKDIDDTIGSLVQTKTIPDNVSSDNTLPIKGVPSILKERNTKKDPRNATSSNASSKNMTELQHDVDEIRREGKTWSFGSETKTSTSEAPQSSFRSNLKKSAADSGTVIFSSKDMALGKDVVPNRKRTAPNPPAASPVTSIDDLILNGSKPYNEIVPRLDLSFTNDSMESHMYQEGYIPSKIEPCKFKCIGAGVRLEHSSLKSRTKKMKLSFDAKPTQRFEYQSESSSLHDYLVLHPDEPLPMPDDEPIQFIDDDDVDTSHMNEAPKSTLKSTPAIGASGDLSNYQPKQMDNYVMGQVDVPKPQTVAPSAVDDDSMGILPADDVDVNTWSDSTTSDLLF